MQKTIERREVREEGNAEIRELIYAMLNGDTYTSLQAIGALGAMGAPVVEPLVRTLLTVDSDARWSVAMALARAGTEAVEPLVGVVLVADDGIKNPAIWALAEIGDRRAVDPLVGTLRTSRSECCRALTAAALLKLGDPAGIAEVEKTFEQSGEGFAGLVMEAFEGT
ncbi:MULTISPECIES: HEAT repeat domain-containing protein [Methanoculleus]|uniref:PBS lyase HEAT domain protein repeat-containing protein n=2 Tax=Methanoculleus TaxID=45989 RepID=A3CYE7_METMJ|nr:MULTISPECIES: HEAT repeat domain-containing protein [Methanoculleus]ABN58397.1 PBS lyase HEAT domain protein repeat-containing protein [Methanoculleus marisnigri JR1]MCC7554637.1 HEAT repeat domain-containing protein [Methanoculleus marisnigri]UYU17395.1 HEAT repeat domain-containing protein [Methanoculleus submarinus]